MNLMRVAGLAALVATLATAAAAQPDNGKGHGRGGGPPPGAGGPDRGGPPGQPATIVVSDRDRGVVYSYYRTEYAAGNCPPGLAKKNNGCLPPGQAKKLWVMGQPLPAAIVYEPLPPVLLGRMSPPPAGYQYARVANDILLLAIGTRMVAAAVADLGRF